MDRVLIFLSLIFLEGCSLRTSMEESKDVLLKGNDIRVSLVNFRSLQLTELNELTKEGSLQKDFITKVLAHQNWNEGIRIAKEHLRVKPFHKNSMLLLAVCYLMKGDIQLAVFFSKKILDNSGQKSPTALNILGLSHIRGASSLDDFKVAGRYFQNSFDASVEEVAAGLNLGYLKLQFGAAGDANSVFSAVERRCGECREALVGKAIALNRLEHYSEAKQLLDVVLDADPKNPQGLYQMALYYKNHEGNLLKSKAILSELETIVLPSQAEFGEKIKLLLGMYAQDEGVLR